MIPQNLEEQEFHNINERELSKDGSFLLQTFLKEREQEEI